jgi:trans-aconitate methyltransferase
MRQNISLLMNKYPIIPSDVKSVLRVIYNAAEIKRASLHDSDYQKNCPYLPPAGLRKRVSGTTDVNWFVNSGIKNVIALTDALKKQGYKFSNFKRVLDFGCGCSRVLTHLRNGSSELFGTDSDSQAIEWCKESLNFASFSTNQMLPPTGFGSQQFDLIYGISIFTHFDESYQFKWLDELKRISSPQSILLLTVMGDYAASLNMFTAKEKKAREEKGFVHRFYRENFPFPVTYGDTYHTKEYIYENWSKYFKIVDYIERGLNDHQDIIVLQKND